MLCWCLRQSVESLRYKPLDRGFDYHWCLSGYTVSWRGKDGRCVVLQLYRLHMPIVLKSGNLNLLEPSGTVQGCNGMALPLLR